MERAKAVVPYAAGTACVAVPTAYAAVYGSDFMLAAMVLGLVFVGMSASFILGAIHLTGGQGYDAYVGWRTSFTEDSQESGVAWGFRPQGSSTARVATPEVFRLEPPARLLPLGTHPADGVAVR